MGRIHEPERRAAADPRMGRKRHDPPAGRVVVGGRPGGEPSNDQLAVAEILRSMDDHRRERRDRRWTDHRQTMLLFAIAATLLVVAMLVAGALMPFLPRIAAIWFHR